MVVLITGSIFIVHLKHKYNERTTIHLFFKHFLGTFNLPSILKVPSLGQTYSSHRNHMSCDSRKSLFFPWQVLYLVTGSSGLHVVAVAKKRPGMKSRECQASLCDFYKLNVSIIVEGHWMAQGGSKKSRGYYNSIWTESSSLTIFKIL